MPFLQILRNNLRKNLILLGLAVVISLPASAQTAAAPAPQPQPWTVLGPDGGDVRSLAFDPLNPDHLFLGTNAGTIFSSTDGGHNWSRFAQLGSSDDYVVDHIVIDPQSPDRMYAAAWSVSDQHAGDLFRSMDGGHSWSTVPAMHGQSIRALAISASDPRVIAVGTLVGVFRTVDGGSTWPRITPYSQEVKNIESLAIDPKNPDVVYAGTWHLAWKTADGGATWQHINKGMIDDSDVFSVIVDSTNPSVVFASACSGIYKSETAGDSFHKLQGIPFTARRTRVLKQDPSNPAIVYAGTTEGLWKTSDAGKTWKSLTGPDVVVNDVLVDPRSSSRVMLATDRGGVMSSNDGGVTFSPSNHGYSHRYVTSIVEDKSEPGTILVGIVNDKEWGGVFSFREGERWQQRSSGLGGRDVFALKQASNGDFVAGTNRGVFLLARGTREWKPINTVVIEKTSMRSVKGAKQASAKGAKAKKPAPAVSKTYARSTLDARINDLEIGPTQWLAATSAGLFTSSNHGASWSGGPVLGKQEFVAVKAHGELIVAATRTNVLVSTNGGAAWQQAGLPAFVTSIRGLELTPEAEVMVATREGAFRNSDSGATWERMLNGLPDKEISSISYDNSKQRLLATSTVTGVVFESRDGGRSWQRGPDSGYPLRLVSVVGGRLMGATPFDGVIVQPEENLQHVASAGSQ